MVVAAIQKAVLQPRYGFWDVQTIKRMNKQSIVILEITHNFFGTADDADFYSPRVSFLIGTQTYNIHFDLSCEKLTRKMNEIKINLTDDIICCCL